MKHSFLGLGVGLVISAHVNSAPCTNIRFETVKSLSIRQISQFATEQAEHDDRHALVLRSFDSEDRPWRDSWQAGALLMVATGDLGETPVGALIWTTELVELRAEKLPAEGFRIIAKRYDETCSPVTVEVHVLADGTVRADRQRLGELK